MNNDLLRALITETVKDRIKQIKEKAEASKTAHAKDVIKVLEDEAKVLDKLAAIVKKEYEKHEFVELKKELSHFEHMRDSKLAKAEALKKKHMSENSEEETKKMVKENADGGGSMLKAQLKKIAWCAKDAYEKIDSSSDVETWVEDHVAKAEMLISEVHEYINSLEIGAGNEEMDESFKSVEKSIEKKGHKSKEAATKIAGAIAQAKMKGAGSGPTAKQKARVKEGLPKGYWGKEYGVGKKVEERKLSGKEEKIVKGIKKSGQFKKDDPAIYAIAAAKAKGQGKK
jgi:hypothetical protein